MAKQAFADQRLGRAVGVRDEVAGALDPDLDVAEAGEMRLREGAGLAGDGDRCSVRILRVVDGHGVMAAASPSGSSVVIWSTLSATRRAASAEAFRRHALDRVGVDAAALRMDRAMRSTPASSAASDDLVREVDQFGPRRGGERLGDRSRRNRRVARSASSEPPWQGS